MMIHAYILSTQEIDVVCSMPAWATQQDWRGYRGERERERKREREEGKRQMFV
jgi:hypothetical protein